MAFVVVAIAVAVAYAALIRGQLSYGLEYDESYLLGVVENIASGRGFIDDGVSYFSTGEPFQPNISTGPVMLLPSALVWMVSDGNLTLVRLVPIAFFLLYLAATTILFYRWRGRWAALAALVGPLLLPILMPDLTNESVMPGRFVGDLPATALLMAMAVLLARRRLVWAGLLGGLAIQTKFNFALPVLVLIAVWLIGSWLAHSGPQPRSLLRLLPGLVLPTAVFEGYKFVSLGPGGYAHNIELVRAFATLNTMHVTQIPDATLKKLGSLTHLLSGPAVILIVVAACVLVALVLLGPYLRPEAKPGRTHEADDAIALVAVLASALSFLLWWVFISAQTSLRPVVPVSMLALSMMAAAMVVAAIGIVARSDGRLRRVATALPVLAVGVLLLCTTYQGIRIARNDTGRELQDSQRQAAAVIVANADVLPIDDFWTNPEFGVLTDLSFQSGSRSDPPLLVFTSVRALTEHSRADARLYADACGVVLFESTDVLVCRPKP
jgi:hypothetical protein